MSIKNKIAYYIVHSLVIPFFFISLLFAVLIARFHHRKIPHLIWGPTPIICIKDLSHAAQMKGYKSCTVVYSIYSINAREDFDYVIEDFSPHISILGYNPFRILTPIIAPYIIFIWALFRADIFHFYYDGGFLAPTPLRFYECQLLKIAKKKTMLMPYGSDIAIISELRESMKNSWMNDYPNAIKRDSTVRRQVKYFTQRADFTIGCISQLSGWQPRQDLTLFNYLLIDTDIWKSDGRYSSADGDNREVIVIHTPNHRAIKGTDFLIRAVDQLKLEGLKIRLEILEGKPNSEVKNAILNADILAEQFIAGYALSAIEGMSMGKPVLSNLTCYPPDLFSQPPLKDCPIINTPPEKIKENLRNLVKNPLLRQKIGIASRDYVEKYHSYEAIGAILDMIYKKIWK